MKRKSEEIKKMVRDGYAKAVTRNTSCCSGPTCCSGTTKAKQISKAIGYSESDMNSAPEEANLGFGCGNPVALASLKKGDVVLDLGSGAGFDVFLAAKEVGPDGRVIGIDMTSEMIDKAKLNAKKGKYSNVDFRLGEIEKLPVEDKSIDVVISNCVINLSPDKEQVFREAFRVLKPSGRLMISDLALLKDLPNSVKESVEAYVGCIAGAISKDTYIQLIKKAGFEDVGVISQSSYPVDNILDNFKSLEDVIVSLKISAKKPVT